MPELPEVETIKLGLQRKIVGLTIKKIQVLNPKTFQGDEKLTEGKQVVGVWRRAKMLGIDISSRQSSAISHQKKNQKSLTADDSVLMTILFHLKMTGQLVYVDKSDKQKEKRLIGGHPTEDMRDTMPNSHTRVILEFSDQSKLYFNDQRKFGWVKVVSYQSSAVRQLLEKLGPEPLEKEFSWENLKANLLRHKSQPIKVAIMDQSVIAGVGNIYASESLFNAKIDPRRKVGELTDSDFKDVLKGLREALTMGIKHGGSSRAHFVNSEGKKGYFLDYANVYGKVGYLCNKCKGKVEKITQVGRGTYYCPNCQH